MLQQTQVSRVIDRYHEFLRQFPAPADCAAAPTSAVIELWAGLGYNRRAVNLWRAAVAITEDHGGQMPSDLPALLALPGVGSYTARAVLAFAFEADVGVVDTNVGRLLARWSGRSLSPKQAQAMADELVPPGSGWSWNQSLFDFAVAVCTKRDPACTSCALATTCTWAGQGDDPAQTSAGVSAKQSKFEGSERQVRGQIVDALRSGAIRRDGLGQFARPNDSLADVERIAQTLIRDGLVVASGEWLQLP